ALCQNQSERIGLWFRPVVNPDDNAARDRGLQRLSLLQVGETVVFFINSSLIYRTAFDAWNQQPRRLNGDGNPDPNGPIHLTSFSLSFESPNRVVTRIGGFDERPWPDVDFTVAITDTLALSAGGVRCDSVTTLDADTSWVNFLTLVLDRVPSARRRLSGRANYRRSRRCSRARRRSRMQRGRADLPRNYDSARPQGGLFLPAPQCRHRRHFCGWILRYRAAHPGSLPHRTDANLRARGHLFRGPHLRRADGCPSWVTAHRLERRRRCFEPGRADDRHPLQLGNRLARTSGGPAGRRPRNGCRRIGRGDSSRRVHPRRAEGRRRFSAGVQTKAMAAAMSGADGPLARRPYPAS